MGWNVRRSSTFSPPVSPRFFFPCEFLCPALGFTGLPRLCSRFSFQALSARLFHSLHLPTRFNHRTVFCRWDNDVFILHTTRRSASLRYPALLGERPRAQPIVAAGFEPACRYHPGGTRNTGSGGARTPGATGTGCTCSGRPGTGDPRLPPQLRRISPTTRLA